MLRRFVHLLAIASCFAVIGCKKPAEPAPDPVPTPNDSWIGVELREEREPGDEIRTYHKRLVVVGTVPTAPAAAVFKEGDVIVGLGTAHMGRYADFSESVRRSPADRPLEVTVLRGDKEETLVVTPERKPKPDLLLHRLYGNKKPFPSLSGTISTARADGTGVVEGTQCVISGKSECPNVGTAGNTNLALGPATIVVFWSQYSPGGPQALKDLISLEKDFGPRGLKIVGITSDSPEAIATFLKPGTHPPMTVISMYLGDYGGARFAARENPAILLLDQKSEIWEAGIAGPEILALLRQSLLPWLLDPRQ